MNNFFKQLLIQNKKVVTLNPSQPAGPPEPTGDYVYEEGTPMATTSAPDDSGQTFIEASSAFVGAVTPTSFEVKAKMSGSGSARLVVYKDIAMTEVVAYSNEVTTVAPYNTMKFEVTGLNPSNKLYWSINSGNQKTAINGSVKTMPQYASSYRVITSSCGRGYYFGDGADVSESSVSNTPMFDYLLKHYGDAMYFLHTGDLMYADAKLAVDESDFHLEYDRLASHGVRQVKTYRNIPISYVWDDHDYKTPHQAVYRERMPHFPLPNQEDSLGVYHTFTIGRVRYIMLDMRTYRDNANDDLLGATQMQWFKDTLANSDELVNVVSVGHPFNSFAGSDNWVDALPQRQEIIDYIRSINRDGTTVLIAGDLHGLSFDNGYNAEGLPVLHAGSIDSVPNDDTSFEKYVQHTTDILMSSDQFVDMEFLDDGINLDLKARGIRAMNGEDGGEEVRMSHEQTFSAGDIAFITQNNSNQDNNFTLQFEERSDINQADRYIVTVNNKPQVSINATGAKTYSTPITLEDGANVIQVLNLKEYQITGVIQDPLKTHVEDRIIGLSSKLTVNANGTAIVYDSDYQAVLDYATNNSISLPSTAQQIEDNFDLLAMTAVGMWDKDDCIFKLKGTASSAFKLIDWKRLTQATPNGGLTWNTTGVKGNGTDAWIDTGYNPSTDAVNYALDNASIMYCSTFVDNTDTGYVVGATGSGLGANREAGSKYFYLHGGYSSVGGFEAELGVNMLGRTTDPEIIVGITKRLTKASSSSAGVPTDTYGILYRNRAGGDEYSNSEVSFVGIGAKKTKQYSLIRKILE
jgi:hypothetical protein